MTNVVIYGDYVDQEVEFQSTLSLDDLLRLFEGVVDAHVAFQTLMPIEKYTGERNYYRTLDEYNGVDFSDY